MLNHFNFEIPQYFKTSYGEVSKSSTYSAEVIAGDGPITTLKDAEGKDVEKVKVPVHIDCWDKSIGSYKNSEINISADKINCHHCDCHIITGSQVIVNIPCDPCDKCGNGDGTMEEPADYSHFQNNCPDLYPDGPLEITCFGQTCVGEDQTHIDYFILDPEETHNQEFGYTYREGLEASWDYVYGYVGNAPVEYGEKETYRCIVSYSGGCLDGSDFMKKTPEIYGNSELIGIYRKIVNADEFNKCGNDRLPSLTYSDFDLIKVDAQVWAISDVEKIDFFPQAAVATKVDLNVLNDGLESYGLNLAQQVRINDILGQLYNPEAVVQKTQVETQKGFCGMGAKFRNRRDKTTDPIDYSVVCKWDQYIPSLYAEMYGTVNKEDYQSILKRFDDILSEFGLTESDGQKILMSHFYGGGSYCKERMDRATRVPSINGYRITNGYDSFGFFGCRFVNSAGQGDDDLDDPEINCNGTGTATFQLDSCDGQDIGWTLVDSTCPDCIPDAPTEADERQIAQCKRYIEEGDVEPPKITLACKDGSADCGSATFELQNKGGVIGADCDGFQAIIRLISLDGDVRGDGSIILVPTWEVVISNCPFECGPKLPLTATPQEIEDFRKYEQDPQNNKPPEKFVNCESLSGGLDTDWKWVITDPCANEECTAEYPDGPSDFEIGQAQQGNTQRRTVKCYKGDEPDKDLGPSCIIKCEDKPTPKPYTPVEGRKCEEDLLTDYANKVIGYTEKDAQSRSPQVLFDNLIKPISPSELESGLNGGNRPQYEIVAHKELCSLEQYGFTLGD